MKKGLCVAIALGALVGMAAEPVSVLDQAGWCNWCPSPTKLPDGRFALAFSRWPKEKGFGAWITDSEIALAVADRPLGPYQFVKTILAGSGRESDFDRDVAHNPNLLVDGGRYYLYYMGTRSDGAGPRVNQRIGVAVANAVEGPYMRHGEITFDARALPDMFMCSNPSVCRLQNGKFLMVFKWSQRPALKWPRAVVQMAAAISESPLGPWKLLNRDIFPVPGVGFAGEDPFVWCEGNEICCAIHDMGRFYSSENRALVWFTTQDGVNWKNRGCLFPKGEVSRLERPAILCGADGSRLLFAASKPSKTDDNSLIVAYPGVAPEPNRMWDLVVYGATSAGLATAVQAKRMGLDVVVLEPTRQIGGLTTGGLGATDIGRKEAFGGIALEFYCGVKEYYDDPAHWKWQKSADYKPDGQCAGTRVGDSMWTFEPSAARAVLEGWVARDKLDIRRGEWLNRDKGGVTVDPKTRRIVKIKTLSGKTYRAKTFVDATYEGDLLAAAGVPYSVGREANSVYGEQMNGVQCFWGKWQNYPRPKPSKGHQLADGIDPYVVKGEPKSGLLPFVEPEGREAPDGAGDHRVQAYCFRMCLTDVPENRIPFKKPKDYDERDYELLFRNAEQGADLSGRINSAMPNRKTDTNNYGGFSLDFIGGNWDYPEASYAERERIVAAHLCYQQGLMWTLANHPRVPEKARQFWSQWGTCRDEFVGERGDGWQNQLYVREARRMIGDYMMTEHECRGERRVPRPVAMAAYGMDSHHVRRHVVDGMVKNEGNVENHRDIKGPYGIDYGAVVPRRVDCTNLLVPICVSATHIAFGSIRMEPVFFALGQVAGTAAALAVKDGVAVQDVDYGSLRARLLADGQVIENKEKEK